MAVLQMKRIHICALKENRKQILELLQQKGVVELDTSMTEDEVFQKSDTSASRGIFEKNASALDHALEILQTYVPEKKGMLSSLEGKTSVDYDSYSSIVERQDLVMSQARQVLNLSKQIAENKANILKKQNQMEALEPWKNLDVPMNFSGTRKTAAFVGAISSVMTQEQIYAGIAEAAPELEGMDIQVVSSDKDQTYVCVLCGVKDAPVMEEALRGMGFARPAQTGGMIPAERQARLQEKITVLEEKNQELEVKIAEYAQGRDEMKLAADYYRTRAAKYEVLGRLLQSRKTFVLSGYIPECAAGSLKEELEKKFTLSVEVTELEEDEEPPVLLKNNSYSRSFEGVVASFGLPHKGEIDPTTIMSFFYFVFFGLMLSDAGYGALIFFGLLFVLKKFPNMEEGLKKALTMFMWCGLSTMIWGLLFGGFFGDIVDVVAANYFGITAPDGGQLFPVLWFVPLKDPMRMLMYSMLFGVIHLFTGLALKGYTCLKDKRYGDFMWEVVIWFIFLIGLILLLLPSSIFEGIAGMDFPDAFSGPGKVLSIVGLVGILFMGERKNKNWLLRILLGAYDIYGVTSWLSDVLSYSRLLALGLATGVIASVINQMGSMVGTSVIGTIVFIIIFIGGQAFSLAINLLGAYVHTNRLQYVEFFGKFYEGGGRPFNPFKITTKYISVKEES